MFQIILGTGLLFLVLAMFTLFSYKAPYGMKAMGALSATACATLLVEAFHSSLLGEQFGMTFLKEVGVSSGSLPGVAAGILVPLALGVSPIYSVLIGATLYGYGILPGFIVGYLMSFVVKYLEKKLPPGLDLILILLICAPMSRGIALLANPVVSSTLCRIGAILTEAADKSPIFMGIILGGIITVVATCPLSSMALTSLINLTGVPMGIGALSVFASSFLNYVFFSKMKFGSKKDTISVAIEPLTQSDIVSANPIPIYVTNFVAGAISGIIIAIMKIGVDVPGVATPIAGFAISISQNGKKGLITAVICAIVNLIIGFIFANIFKNYKIKTADEIRGVKTLNTLSGNAVEEDAKIEKITEKAEEIAKKVNQINENKKQELSK